MRRLLLAAALLLPLGALAQPLTLTPRPDAEEGLPPSVRVFDVTREGTPLRASLVRADLSSGDWALEAVLSDEGGGETVPSFADDDGVFVAANGGYFGGGQSFSLVREGSVTLTPNIRALTRGTTTFYPTRGAFGVGPGGAADVAWTYTLDGTTYAYPQPSPNAPGAPQPQPTAAFPAGGTPWDVTTAIGGGPVLVQDGRADLTWTEEVFFGGSGVDTTSARARTAVGYTAAGDLLLVVVPERSGLTLPALAALFVDLGAVEALNLDGGGSSALSAGGVSLVDSGRPVVSVLRLRRPGGAVEPPDDGTVIDTGDDGYREVGEWSESANTPFFGGTPSRLNVTGAGDDRAVFAVGDLAAGRYAVEAWWVPAGNRATNTPFTVYQGGAGTTVRVDQTDLSTAGRWNALGTFDLAPGDSVVVTDAAAGTTAPAFVSVDAIRLVRQGGTAGEAGPEAAGALRVWPNPASASVTVALDVPRPAQFEIVDVLGRVVQRFAVSGGAGPTSVEVAGLPAGAYVVRATADGRAWTARLTVVR